MAQRILRPLGFGDIIDETFDLYKKHFLLFAGISALIIMPIMLVRGFERHIPHSGHQHGGIMSTPLFLSEVLGLASWAIAPITTWAVSQTYLGNIPTVLDSYRAVSGRWLSLLWTMIAISVLTYIGYWLLLVPGIYFALTYALVLPVFIIEGLATRDAMRRSGRLASGYYWQIFLVLLATEVPIAIEYFINVCLYWSRTVQHYRADLGHSIVLSLLQGIMSCIVTPFPIIATVLLYFDIRIRKEGLDIALLAQDLGQTLPPQADTGGVV